jgi:hypothetical protein
MRHVSTISSLLVAANLLTGCGRKELPPPVMSTTTLSSTTNLASLLVLNGTKVSLEGTVQLREIEMGGRVFWQEQQGKFTVTKHDDVDLAKLVVTSRGSTNGVVVHALVKSERIQRLAALNWPNEWHIEGTIRVLPDGRKIVRATSLSELVVPEKK